MQTHAAFAAISASKAFLLTFRRTPQLRGSQAVAAAKCAVEIGKVAEAGLERDGRDLPRCPARVGQQAVRQDRRCAST